ncbi:uncharacterized protein L969DRAFT_93032 [Mixia osmundae IAM 14324]|uniref:Uncharacterized protein n=1 Tax=Mixia osmundae (strain CBS 9802 / IAM 14324 / JCM 22182 / KY 12970) TaxID=764103 RepID=G7E6B2_MIXOS|nr:uncharacterized protein L969DRAFT_93032 [Mixia osmundae IAM 14324]KEI40472.1 hypothetical protein L969DRAFT_93032 [Mixia osmundae IAM 14324]GAA98372.1 hypothetical protein E5Q_05058 [Mixia osmundae IAM 14324]
MKLRIATIFFLLSALVGLAQTAAVDLRQKSRADGRDGQPSKQALGAGITKKWIEQPAPVLVCIWQIKVYDDWMNGITSFPGGMTLTWVPLRHQYDVSDVWATPAPPEGNHATVEYEVQFGYPLSSKDPVNKSDVYGNLVDFRVTFVGWMTTTLDVTNPDNYGMGAAEVRAMTVRAKTSSYLARS